MQVLRDPKQKRFFKSKDIHDLFTLGDQYGGASETAQIFSSLHGGLEVPLDPDSVALPVQTDATAGFPLFLDLLPPCYIHGCDCAMPVSCCGFINARHGMCTQWYL